MSIAPTPEEVLAPALTLAQRHHAEGIDVQDLADHVSYSRFHFSRIFAATMRLTPGQYLTCLRMDHAKRLLIGQPDPVIDVAMSVGFESLSSFARRFRTMVGVPPATFRALAKRVDDAPPRPFERLRPQEAMVLVRPTLPPGVSDATELWLGWFAQPAPIGLPGGGRFAPFDEEIPMRLAPGTPWLLGFAVEPERDPRHHLIPRQPLVAVHPAPLTGPSTVVLPFSRAGRTSVPLIVALPSLCLPGE